MRGSRAKKIMAVALAVCNKDGISGGEGRGQYHQAMNCRRWEAFTDKDGFPLRDPDTGEAMVTIKEGPGTLTTAWKLRALYQLMKKAYKRKASGVDQK